MKDWRRYDDECCVETQELLELIFTDKEMSLIAEALLKSNFVKTEAQAEVRDVIVAKMGGPW